MECKLELSVFRFDATTDFLPYYKKHFITIDTQSTLSDLLAAIKTEDATFGYPQMHKVALKVNQRALFSDVTLDTLIKTYGKSLTLEPLSTKRVVKDLVINVDDFYQRFDLLKAFVDEKDKAVFESYIIYHYASRVLDFLPNFQRDALFAFAYDMIQKHPERKREILEVIAHEEFGIFSRIKLCKKIYPCGAEVEKKVVNLKNDILQQRPYINHLVEKLSHRTDLM